MIREQELHAVMNWVNAGDCASIVGLSNMGKSALLREMGLTATQKYFHCTDHWIFAYVDCNLMPERSEQAFHEVIVRSLISALKHHPQHTALIEPLSALYQQIVEPSSPIKSPLAFDDALGLVCEQPDNALTIGFDEFDDPFEKLTGRTFLNLRAIKDKFGGRITYVSTTDKPLTEIRNDGEANEFIELFADRVQWVGLLSRADSCKVVTDVARSDAAKLHEDELNFIVNQAGGHAAMLTAVTNIWRRTASNTNNDKARAQTLELMKQAIETDATVRSECLKIWAQLSQQEREAMIAAVGGKKALPEVLATLRTKRLIPSEELGLMAGDILRGFIKQQNLIQPGKHTGVQVDVDAGEVKVDGRDVEPLTELEYKLLLLLYGRMNKIVDKFAIVTNVWGENYLDSVDDARIEKLVSRLRGKLEPAADEPKYLITLRGRGYKLVG